MTLQELNVRLNNINLNLRADRMRDYDTDKVSYDTWFEYFNHTRKKWSIEHVLGFYDTEREAIKAALDWLTLNHIRF